jgi:hypothetical protein
MLGIPARTPIRVQRMSKTRFREVAAQLRRNLRAAIWSYFVLRADSQLRSPHAFPTAPTGAYRRGNYGGSPRVHGQRRAATAAGGSVPCRHLRRALGGRIESGWAHRGTAGVVSAASLIDCHHDPPHALEDRHPPLWEVHQKAGWRLWTEGQGKPEGCIAGGTQGDGPEARGSYHRDALPRHLPKEGRNGDQREFARHDRDCAEENGGGRGAGLDPRTDIGSLVAYPVWTKVADEGATGEPYRLFHSPFARKLG